MAFDFGGLNMSDMSVSSYRRTMSLPGKTFSVKPKTCRQLFRDRLSATSLNSGLWAASTLFCTWSRMHQKTPWWDLVLRTVQEQNRTHTYLGKLEIEFWTIPVTRGMQSLSGTFNICFKPRLSRTCWYILHNFWISVATGGVNKLWWCQIPSLHRLRLFESWFVRLDR